MLRAGLGSTQQGVSNCVVYHFSSLSFIPLSLFVVFFSDYNNY